MTRAHSDAGHRKRGLGRSALSCLFLVIVLVPGFTLSSCRSAGSGEPAALRVAAPALEQNALLYVAEARHLFERSGVQVTIQDYETGVATMDALLGGQAEIAELAEFPFVRPALEGQPVRIIAVNDRFENDYLLVRKDRGIVAEADLKGKNIGVIPGTILEFYLGRFLELHGIGAREVTIVDTVSPSQTTAAIVSGQLDAVVAFQPHVNSIQGRLDDAVQTWPVQSDQLVYGILAANDGWLAANGDTVKRFLDALVQAEAYVAGHPEQAQAIVRDRLGLDAGYLATVWPLHQFSLSLDFSLIVAMNDEARWMLDQGLIQAAIPDFTGFVSGDGLAAAKPEAVRLSH